MSTPSLAAALLSELDDIALKDRLRPLVAELIREQQQQPQQDGWLDAKRAAGYLSITANALHKLTAAREIPFEQGGPGCKLWFRPSELDAWRRGEKWLRSQDAAKGRISQPAHPAPPTKKPRLSGAFT